MTVALGRTEWVKPQHTGCKKKRKTIRQLDRWMIFVAFGRFRQLTIPQYVMVSHTDSSFDTISIDGSIMSFVL